MVISSHDYIDEIIKISDKKDILISDNPFSKYIVYLENSKVVGFCYYYDIYDRLEIAYIFVKDEYRNKNIASKIIEYLISNNLNKKNITLEVNENNINAIKLYKKYNFVEVATRKGYYNSEDGILMELNITK